MKQRPCSRSSCPRALQPASRKQISAAKAPEKTLQTTASHSKDIDIYIYIEIYKDIASHPNRMGLQVYPLITFGVWHHTFPTGRNPFGGFPGITKGPDCCQGSSLKVNISSAPHQLALVWWKINAWQSQRAFPTHSAFQKAVGVATIKPGCKGHFSFTQVKTPALLQLNW